MLGQERRKSSRGLFPGPAGTAAGTRRSLTSQKANKSKHLCANVQLRPGAPTNSSSCACFEALCGASIQRLSIVPLTALNHAQFRLLAQASARAVTRSATLAIPDCRLCAYTWSTKVERECPIARATLKADSPETRPRLANV